LRPRTAVPGQRIGEADPVATAAAGQGDL
jgi:hypothetical protein